jgi:hypothetical protein
VKSQTLPSFWEAYQDLPEQVKRASRKSYDLWLRGWGAGLVAVSATVKGAPALSRFAPPT